MYYNRIAFNRPGIVIYAKAEIKSTAAAKVEADRAASAKIFIESESKLSASTDVVTFVSAKIESKSTIRAWIYSPVYIRVKIQSKSTLKIKPYKFLTERLYFIGLSELRADAYAVYSPQISCNTRAKFTANINKLHSTAITIKAISLVEFRQSVYRNAEAGISLIRFLEWRPMCIISILSFLCTTPILPTGSPNSFGTIAHR